MMYHDPSSVSSCDNQEGMLSFQTTINEVFNPTQIGSMTELSSQSCEDQMFIAKLKDGIHKDAGGHQETPLPFCDSSPCFPNDKAHAFNRLQHLKKRLQKT